MIIEDKILTQVEIETLEKEFLVQVDDYEYRSKLWSNFVVFFNKKSAIERRKYFTSYWRWFVDLSWKRLDTIDIDFFVDEVVENQIPMACMLGYPIIDKLLIYFRLHIFDRQTMATVFLQSKQKFLQSGFIIGEIDGKNYSILNAVEEIKTLGSRDSSSMKEAEFKVRLKNIMYPKKDLLIQKYFVYDSYWAIDQFIGVIYFFLGLKPEHVWYVVDGFMNPSKYFSDLSLEEQKVVENKNYDNERSVDVVAGVKTKSTKPSLPQIRTLINSQFPPDAAGQYKDITAVFARLGELAEENGMPEIGEMLYWDENQNKFVWKE